MFLWVLAFSLVVTCRQVCSLIAYICVEVEACSSTWTATYGYFKFISIAAMLTTLILWVMLLLKVPQRILRCDCVRWPFPVRSFQLPVSSVRLPVAIYGQ